MVGPNCGGKTPDARARSLARLKFMEAHLSPKDRRRLKKMEKQAGKAEAKQARADNRGWTKLEMRGICGCCTAELWYSSRERAEAAARDVSLRHAVLTDDRGNTEHVDGFYGAELTEFQ